MALPNGVTTTTVTFGPYTDAAGVAQFAGVVGLVVPSSKVTHVATGAVIAQTPVKVTLDSSGSGSVTLPNTDLASCNPVGFTYTLSWQVGRFDASPGNLTFALPAAGGTTVDFDSLTPTPTSPGVFVPVVSGGGGAGGAVASVNGKIGVVTLSAADVGADATGVAAAAQAASLQKSANLSDITTPAAARTNLGLGSAATQPSSAFDAAGAASAAQAAAATDATTKANAAQAAAVQRANHTGTQPVSTVTGLATIATSGAYADLSGKPVIPAAYTDEQAQDAVAAAIAAGTQTGITVAYNDAANSLSFTATGTTSPDATTAGKGIVQLAGDLAGTAAAPTVGKLAGALVAPAPSGDVTGATDTAALQALIDGIASTSLTGGAVQLRPGVYYGRIKMRPLVRIWGSGIGATRLMAPDGATGAVVDTADATQWMGGVEVAHMTIDGNNLGRDGTGTVKSTTVGLNWQSTGDPYVLPAGSTSGPYTNHWDHDPNPIFHHLNVINCGGDGIRLGGQSSVNGGDPAGCQAMVHHCLLFSNWGVGIAVTGPDAMIDHVQIGMSKSHGVSLAGQASAYISNVKSWYSGAWLDGVNFNQFLVGHGFYINGLNGQISLVGCQSQDNGGYGVAVSNCSSVYIGTHQSGGDNLGVFQLAGGATNCRLDGVKQMADLPGNGPLVNIDGAATTNNTVTVWADPRYLPTTPVTFTSSATSTGNTVTVGAPAPNVTVAASVTANGTLAVNRHNPVNATSAALTMTLPTGQTQGTVISAEKTDASTNTVTLSGSIRGTAGSTVVLYWQNESVYFVADGAGSWWPVAGHKTKTALDAAYAQRANNLSDLASAATARTNLGLGTAATQPSTAFDPAGAAAAILPAQTGNSGKYLTTNGSAVSWGAVAGGSGVDFIAPPKVGEWLHHGQTSIAQGTFGSQGTLNLGELIVGAGTYDMVSFNVNTAGSVGAVSKVVIYGDDGTGKPGALLADCTAVDTTATGVKQVTLPAAIVLAAATRLWIGVCTQGSPATVTTYTNVFQVATPVIGTGFVSNGAPQAWVLSGTTGAAPTTGAAATRGNQYVRCAIHRSA